MKNCVDCEEPIPEKRVAALPKTEFCIDCQEIREKNGTFRRAKMEIKATSRCGEIDTITQTIIK